MWLRKSWSIVQQRQIQPASVLPACRQVSTGKPLQWICLIFLIFPEGALLYEHTVSTFCATIFIYEKSIMVLSVSMYHLLLRLNLMFFAMLTAHKNAKKKILKKKITIPDVDSFKEGRRQVCERQEGDEWKKNESILSLKFRKVILSGTFSHIDHRQTVFMLVI